VKLPVIHFSFRNLSSCSRSRDFEMGRYSLLLPLISSPLTRHSTVFFRLLAPPKFADKFIGRQTVLDFNYFKCAVPGCSSTKLWKKREGVNDHILAEHPELVGFRGCLPFFVFDWS